MSSSERAPYNDRAKNDKLKNGKNGRPKEKLTCTGVAINVVQNEKLEQERKEKEMKKYIEKTVCNSVRNNGNFYIFTF